MTPRQFEIQIEQIRRRTMDKQDELLLECRRALNRKGVKWAPIAREAGVTGQTVARLARNETSRPQFVTVLGILAAMGYTITVSEPGQGGKQKVLAEAPPFDDRVKETRARLHLLPTVTRKAA